MADAFSKGFWERTLKRAYPETTSYRLALYNEDPADFEAYRIVGEWRGVGYEPGGARLGGYDVRMNGEVAELHFDNVSWINADIEARYALLYAGDDGRALRVFDLGRKLGVIGGVFDFMFPEGGALQVGNPSESSED